MAHFTKHPVLANRPNFGETHIRFKKRLHVGRVVSLIVNRQESGYFSSTLQMVAAVGFRLEPDGELTPQENNVALLEVAGTDSRGVPVLGNAVTNIWLESLGIEPFRDKDGDPVGWNKDIHLHEVNRTSAASGNTGQK
jgi:hypothetical protein